MESCALALNWPWDPWTCDFRTRRLLSSIHVYWAVTMALSPSDLLNSYLLVCLSGFSPPPECELCQVKSHVCFLCCCILSDWHTLGGVQWIVIEISTLLHSQCSINVNRYLSLTCEVSLNQPLHLYSLAEHCWDGDSSPVNLRARRWSLKGTIPSGTCPFSPVPQQQLATAPSLLCHCSHILVQEDCRQGHDRVTGLGACPILEAIFIQGYLAPGEILLKANYNHHRFSNFCSHKLAKC